MKNTKKLLLISLAILLLLILTVIPMTITVIAYNANFNIRTKTADNISDLKFEDYSNLKRSSIEFKSNNSQTLRGYIYENKNDVTAKALIVFSHGYLGTHIDYLNQINYFTQNGYKVLGFDNTGCGSSDGDTMLGLAQSPIDLDYALKFVESNNDLNKYKILLYGHSWGGYAVSAVLNYNHNITAIVSRSGFSNSRDMLVEYGSRLYGSWLGILSPYAYIYEKTKFGNAVDLNGIKGINNSNCDILLLHSNNDPVISLKNSLLIHKENYKTKDKIHTIRLDTKGHDVVLSDNSIKYNKEQNLVFEDLEKQYDNNIPKDILNNYYSSLDKNLLYELDLNVMNEILNFYNKSSRE